LKPCDWERLPYGHMLIDEPWGDISKVNYYLVYLCDLLRDHLRHPLYVTYGTQGKHLSQWHAKGLAVDLCIDKRKIEPLDVILAVTRLPFTGFGVIPRASHLKCTEALGLHVDVRPVSKIAQPQARWIWVDNKQYRFDMAHLIKFGLL